jgi:hypothetical protein
MVVIFYGHLCTRMYTEYSTVVADFVFSVQQPWAFLPCPPKIYLSAAGGQRGRQPIAVEVSLGHASRLTIHSNALEHTVDKIYTTGRRC